MLTGIEITDKFIEGIQMNELISDKLKGIIIDELLGFKAKCDKAIEEHGSFGNLPTETRNEINQRSYAFTKELKMFNIFSEEWFQGLFGAYFSLIQNMPN